MANSKDNISKYATSFISFDEASGNVYDSIGGYVGTIYNSPTRVEGWNGQGYAMSFNGSNQYISFNGKVFDGNVFSIRFKIKFTDVSQMRIINNLNNDIGFIIECYLGNIQAYYTQGGNADGLVKSKAINDNKWHDVLLIHNNDEVELYVDSILEEKAYKNIDITHNGNTFIASDVLNRLHLKGELDQIEIYDRIISPIPDKHLVVHSNQYKYHDGTNWRTTTPTEENFIQYGHDNLSHITEAQWQELQGSKSIAVWSDFEDKKYVSAVLEKEPFTAKDIVGKNAELILHTTSNAEHNTVLTQVDEYSVYDYISELPTVVAYTESTDDIIISTTTEPYTLYDEFGDEVEILYYTDDEEVVEADLVIEANWSPLDELEGDFEIVTWTDESAESAQRQIEVEGLYPSEYVPMTNWINVKDLVGISIKNVTGVFAPFLIEKKNDPNRYAYHQGYFYPTTEDTHSIHNYGLTPVIINALTKEEWEEFLEGEEEIRFHFLFSNRSIGTVSKSASFDVIHQIGQIQVLRSITRSTPTVTKLELEASVYSMSGRLESIERINLNNLLELELRTAILMKMPLIQSKEMIIETFDSNEYEVAQTIEQQVEVPSTEVDEEGNPLPSTWETITVAKPSDYDATQSAFLNEFKVSVPINVSDVAKKLVMQLSGNGVEVTLTDGVISKTLVDLYNEEVDISAMNKETLVAQMDGQSGSVLKGIAYAWT